MVGKTEIHKYKSASHLELQYPLDMQQVLKLLHRNFPIPT